MPSRARSSVADTGGWGPPGHEIEPDCGVVCPPRWTGSDADTMNSSRFRAILQGTVVSMGRFPREREREREREHRGADFAVLPRTAPGKPQRYLQGSRDALEHRLGPTRTGRRWAALGGIRAGVDAHAPPKQRAAWGVRTRARAGGQERRNQGHKRRGMGAGEPGGREPPRRLSGGECGR